MTFVEVITDPVVLQRRIVEARDARVAFAAMRRYQDAEVYRVRGEELEAQARALRARRSA